MIHSDLIRRKITSSLRQHSELSPDICDKIAFNMVDWLDDFVLLHEIYSDIDNIDNKNIYDALIKFLVHVPGHVVQASELLLDNE